MQKLRRFFYANKTQILVGALIIFFLLAIIHFFDKRLSLKTESDIKNLAISNNDQKNNTQTKSATGKNISSKQLDKETQVIKDFINACNTKDKQKAYDLLSKDCKEEVYPTIEKFDTEYYSSIFNNTEKSFTMENWNDSTYSVVFKSDILATGKNNNDTAMTDYISVVNENEEYKLNVNNYIGETQINKNAFRKNINITIQDKKTYMDYEYYDILIENESANSIMLDPLLSTQTIYLQDSNEVKYTSYSHELIEDSMIVKANHTRNLKIKFSNQYSTSRKIESMVFEKMILNYDDFSNIQNKESYSEYYKFGINL